MLIETTNRSDEREDVASKVAPEATDAHRPVRPTGDATGGCPVPMRRTANESASGLALGSLVEPKRTDYGPRVRERLSNVARVVRPERHVQPSASSKVRNAVSCSGEKSRFFASSDEMPDCEGIPISFANALCPMAWRFR